MSEKQTTNFCSLNDQDYMSEKWTTNFCNLKKRTLQTFVVSKVKDTTNHMSEKQTTNFCSVKKHILETCLVDGISKFCSLKSNFCIL